MSRSEHDVEEWIHGSVGTKRHGDAIRKKRTQRLCLGKLEAGCKVCRVLNDDYTELLRAWDQIGEKPVPMLKPHATASPDFLATRRLHRFQHCRRRRVTGYVNHELVVIFQRLTKHRLDFFRGKCQSKLGNCQIRIACKQSSLSLPWIKRALERRSVEHPFCAAYCD